MRFNYLLVVSLILTSLTLFSCGDDIDEETKSVDVVAFTSPVTKSSGEDGTDVTNPLDETATIKLTEDYFSFSIQVVNNNEKSLVVTGIEAEVVDHNNFSTTHTFSYPPQLFSHCGKNNPDSILGGRYHAFLPTGAEASLGAHENSLFYIDKLLEDSEFSGYRAEVFITVKGFFSKSTAPAPSNDCTIISTLTGDPFIGSEAIFKKIVYVEVFR